MTNNRGQVVKTTIKSLELIEIVKKLDGATPAELRQELGMAESTIYKHLNALIEKGYLMNVGGEYQLGYELYHLGEYVKKTVQYYQPIKEATDSLRDTLPEQVEYAVGSGGLVTGYIVSTNYDSSLFYELTEKNEDEVIDYAGSKAYMHTNAVGKALLAEKTDEEVREIVDQYGLPQQAKNTITSIDELYAELNVIRERGFATTDEEWDNGLREVGMVVKPREDIVVGGFNIFGPIYQINDFRLDETLPRILRETVSDLEDEIAARMEKQRSDKHS